MSPDPPHSVRSEAARTIDELDRVIGGDPWYGDSVSSILTDVSAARAAAKPIASAHSIWEIVRHMTAWTNEVARRLDGHAPGEPVEGDWPAPGTVTEANWVRDVNSLLEAHRQLTRKIAALSDDALYAPPAERRDRAAGSGVSRYVMLHGLGQHHAFHAGQIAVLKKQ